MIVLAERAAMNCAWEAASCSVSVWTVAVSATIDARSVAVAVARLEIEFSVSVWLLWSTSLFARPICEPAWLA